MKALSLAVVGVVLGWSSVSRAVTVRDGGFSIDIRGASVCFMRPQELRDDAACAGLTMPATAPQLGGDNVTVRAYGIVREPTTQRVLGVMQLGRTTGPEDWPDQRAATELSERYARDMAKSFPANAKPHAGGAWVETVGETRIIRSSFDVDGLAPGSIQQRSSELEKRFRLFASGGAEESGAPIAIECRADGPTVKARVSLTRADLERLFDFVMVAMRVTPAQRPAPPSQ